MTGGIRKKNATISPSPAPKATRVSSHGQENSRSCAIATSTATNTRAKSAAVKPSAFRNTVRKAGEVTSAKALAAASNMPASPFMLGRR
jgi:hypothetical protein